MAMKNIIVYLLLVIGTHLFSNPIPLPMVRVSELYFDSDQKFSLELIYTDASQESMPIDSVLIETSEGRVKIKKFDITDGDGYIVVTKYDTDPNLEIQPEGDMINVTSYISLGEGNVEETKIDFAFGEYKHSFIDKPKSGQSIALGQYYTYCKDNTPSIGFENDTSGMCGTIKGIVYDKYDNPVKNFTFSLDFPFTTSRTGDYTARILSRNYNSSHIINKTGPGSSTLNMTLLDFNIEPDQVVSTNIYLTDYITGGIYNVSDCQNIPVTIFPNPLNPGVQLNYIVELPVKSSNFSLEIISIDGIEILSQIIKENTGILEIPGNLKSGTYIVNFYLNNKIIGNKKLVINNQ